MKTNFIYRLIVVGIVAFFATSVHAQIKYNKEGQLTIGNIQPYAHYGQTFLTNGIYMQGPGSNFFQIDATPAATRLASHLDQVVFFNTQTNTYNSIQVKNVYNYSDARAKSNIQPLSSSLSIINGLRPVSYTFNDAASKTSASPFKLGGDGKELGLLAQEVEKILPNVVLTDPDGNKLINYTALIAVLIDAVNELDAKVKALEAR